MIEDVTAIPIFIMFGIIIGIILTVSMYEYLPISTVVKAGSAIKLCERNLPRIQHCIITAIPKELDN